MRLKLKRHYPLLVALFVVIALLTLGIGDQRIVAYTAKSSQQVAEKSLAYTNSTALFDDRVVHSIQILMDDETYQSMITTYQQNREKSYFHADVFIDGVRVNNAGIRLKGNASLRTALGGRGGWGGPGGQPGGGMPDESGAGNRVTQIPMMIKFDEFVSGQRYQGYDRLAIRSAGISYDASMLQEPVTNAIFRLVGLPATETAYAGVTRNDGAEQLFTISEVIEQDFLEEHFVNAGGVLYKAELNAKMSYQGEDPSAYKRSFTQETQVNDADMAPLIKFLQFVSQSADAAFESELSTYLDVDAFATYLAVNNLLVNTDSMAGMGNNYYLYYDNESRRFTVLMWDANESLGKLAGRGFGGRGGGGNAASYDIYYQNTGGGPGMGMRGGSNPLLGRFMASARFKALYEQKLRLVYQKAFASGAIMEQIGRYTAVVRQGNTQRSFVDSSSYEQAVASVQHFIAQRGEYLASTPLLGGQANLSQ